MPCIENFYWSMTMSAGGVEYDLSRDLSSLTVDEEDRAPTGLTVEVSDPLTVFSHAFREGVDVAVELGTEENHGVVFRGRIYHVDGNLPQDGAPMLTLKAYDDAMRMGLRERNRRFRDRTLTEIVTEVAKEYFANPLVKPVGDPQYTGQGLRQREETDLCFLRRLAVEADCAMGVVLANGKSAFVFEAPSVILAQDAPVTLYYGRCDVPDRLLSLQAGVDVGDIAVPSAVQAMDPRSGVVTEVSIPSAPPVPPPEDRFRDESVAAFTEQHPDRGAALGGVIAAAATLDQPVRAALGPWRRHAIPTFASQPEVTQRAQWSRGASLHGMQATGSTVGNRNLHVRAPLQLEGAGRFSGKWYVSKATHTLNREGYRTEFTCTR